MTTLCEDCSNVEESTRKYEWYRWRCIVAPKHVPLQFVKAEPFLTESPHKRCKDNNPAGECEQFERRKEPKDA